MFAYIVGSFRNLKDNLRIVGYVNLAFLFLLGIFAYIISLIDPALDSLFLALVFGIFLGLYTDERKKNIVKKSLGITLPVGITLYGVNMPMHLSDQSFEVIALTLFFSSLMGLTILLLAKKFDVSKKLALLLACGTSICGVSAIAILSPIVKPRKHEFSAAIIIITVVGLTGAVLYPKIGQLFCLSPETYALLSGSTLHQTGLVKIASKPFGEDVVVKALGVKGIRITMIALVALLVSFVYSEHKFYVPWYIGTFLIVALFSGLYFSEYVDLFKPISTIAFSITLASIGCTVNLKQVQRVSLIPLFLAYFGWSISLFVFILVFWRCC